MGRDKERRHDKQQRGQLVPGLVQPKTENGGATASAKRRRGEQSTQETLKGDRGEARSTLRRYQPSRDAQFTTRGCQRNEGSRHLRRGNKTPREVDVGLLQKVLRTKRKTDYERHRGFEQRSIPGL